MNHANHGQGLTGVFQSTLDWFAGDGAYHNLVQCMGHDYLWIGITVALDVAVAAGYMLIAKHWWKNERLLPDVPARRALANMRNIFLFCGICGYLFIPVKMFWPAWRLYDIVMVALVYFTWRYAWGSTDLKVIYTELGRGTRLAEELEATKVESRQKTEFLNAISHDLRTPLNGLMLQANLMEMNAAAGDHDGVKAALRDMKASARATSDLLDSLLEYARLDFAADPHHVVEFNLASLIREVCLSHQAAATSANLTLQFDCPDQLAITADRCRLERIISNLVSNAIKFTKTGGVRVNVASAGQHVEVHVVDTGVGIDRGDRERLFEEFYQVNNHERDRRKGFGLGLAIARRLARQLGGDITIDSAAGQGSRFTVALPGVIRPDVRQTGAEARPDRSVAVAAG